VADYADEVRCDPIDTTANKTNASSGTSYEGVTLAFSPSGLASGADTVGGMTDAGSRQKAVLGALAPLAQRAAEARIAERKALKERECAVVAAVRAGARLDEIGSAARVTKSAVSAVARRILPARPARGGPYQRRRGVEAALAKVERSAERAVAATSARRAAIDARDRAVVAAFAEGRSVASIAEVLGMEPKVVHTLIRRRHDKAT
jgi:DNA-binding NarL/FixJ family response regulator